MDSAEKLDMENIDESEGEEEDDSHVEVSDSEDEDDEPKLKYQRLGSSVGEILKRDQASCMAVHSKFLALGTIFGAVYILDFNGNEIRRFPCHNQVIHEISIDESGEYVASCAEDGRVCINGLYASESMEFSYPKPVTALALDPLFAKKNSKAFAFGGRGGTLLMSTKGFFGRKDNTIHSGEGPISAIKWRGSLIAWANDQGVKIYDTEKNTRITHIEKPKGNPKPDLFRCHLCWESDNTLLIGWNDSVRIGLVRERFETPHGPSALPSSILPDRYVEISAMFQTDFSICGIAPFGDYLVVLAYVEEEAMPELRILTRTKDEISSDSLTINGYKGCKPNQFRLCHIPEESLFYVVAPVDIIVARPRDLDDHIAWLMEKQKYEEAMIAAEHSEVQLRGHNLAEIGQKYLEHLLENSQVNKAAEMCPKILKRDAKLWEKWIYKFAELSQLHAICDYIPVGNPTLIETVYEMVLGFYMSSPETRYHDKFHNLVIEWPSDIYNIKNVITALKRIISTSTNENAILKQALAKLQYDKALGIYLELKKGPVFELIRDFNLFDAVKDKVLSLVNFDKEKAVQLLVTNPDRILPETAVEQLQADQRLLHEYLHNLFLKDPQDAHTGKLFHEIQVKLYAEYDRNLLLPFLRQSNYYPLAKALQVCEDKQLYPEMVFLMGRMGNNKQGLQLLIEKIGDVKQVDSPTLGVTLKAIEFIETQNDDELWDDLIDYSMKHPKFVSDLLEHIGAYVDPVKLIAKIPGGMEIVGLREKLVKIISDYNLQMSLREGCKEILKADCVDLMQRLSRGQRKAVRVEEEVRCAICSTPVLGSRSGTGLIVFFCHHAFHSKCLRQDSEEGGQSATGAISPKQSPAVDSPKKNPKEEDSKFCPICMNQAKKTKTGAAVPTKTGRKLGAVGSAKVEGI